MIPTLRSLLAVLVAGLLQSSFCTAQSCYKYGCSDTDISSYSGLQNPNGLPYASHCGKGNPQDQAPNTCSGEGGCFAVTNILTVKMGANPTDVLFELKDCAQDALIKCFETTFSVQIAEGKGSCKSFTQSKPNPTEESPEMKQFRECGEQNNVAIPNLGQMIINGVLAGVAAATTTVPGGDIATTESSPAQQRQAPPITPEVIMAAIQQIKVEFCVCRGDMCNDYNKLIAESGKEKPPKGQTGSGTPAPPPPEVPNGAFNVLSTNNMIMILFLYLFSATINY